MTYPGKPSVRGPRPQSTVHLEVELLEERCVLDANFLTAPVVPVITAATQAHLLSIFQYGLALGNRPDVVSRVGDSITATPFFLTQLGNPAYDPSNPQVAGWYTGLASTINYFRSAPVDGSGANSFTHTSFAAYPGWTTWTVLDPARNFLQPGLPGAVPGESPLETELRLTKPSFALIMLGTNDLYYSADPAPFAQRLALISEICIANGVIPVLSTIPEDLLDNGARAALVPAFNQTIANVASSLDVPLWNYWLAMSPLPHFGISGDNVHPDWYAGGSGDFTAAGLQYGFNMRNLTAVEVLAKLQQVIINDGTPDPVAPNPSAAVVQTVDGLFEAVLGRTPSAGELALWGQALQAGTPTGALSGALWSSAEHRTIEVDQDFATLWHRSPDAAEQAFWVNLFLAGAGEQQVQQMLGAWAQYLTQNPGVTVPEVIGPTPAADATQLLGAVPADHAAAVVATAPTAPAAPLPSAGGPGAPVLPGPTGDDAPDLLWGVDDAPAVPLVPAPLLGEPEPAPPDETPSQG